MGRNTDFVTHNEAISISDYFTVRNEDGDVTYRPTCHYAYHPCNDAILSLHELFGNGGTPQPIQHVLGEDELVDGADELGVLLYGHDRNAYWYGSRLSLQEARPRPQPECDRIAGQFRCARGHGLGD